MSGLRQIQPQHNLTKYRHHTLYTLLLALAVIPGSYASLFCMCCMLELPTFILALGSLNKSFRNDYIFGAVFFLTRICLHVYIAVAYARRALSPEGGSWFPTVVLTAVFPVHAMWMLASVKGVLKRRRLAVAAKKAAQATAPITPVAIPSQAARIRDLQAFILSRSRRAASRSATLIRRSRAHVLRLLQDALEEQNVPTASSESQQQHFTTDPPRWRSIKGRVVGRIRRSLPEAYDVYASGPLPVMLAAVHVVEHADRDS